MNIGLEIKRIRKTKGLTQLQMSQKLFVDVSTISKYENGKLEAKTNFLLKMLLALDLSPADYIKELVERYNLSSDKLSKITFINITSINDIENINDVSIVENILDRLLIYIKSLDTVKSREYCFGRGELVRLSDVDDWSCIQEEDRTPSAKFKVITREMDEDKNQYYSVVSLQTNEIFEGYAVNFESIV